MGTQGKGSVLEPRRQSKRKATAVPLPPPAAAGTQGNGSVFNIAGSGGNARQRQCLYHRRRQRRERKAKTVSAAAGTQGKCSAGSGGNARQMQCHYHRRQRVDSQLVRDELILQIGVPPHMSTASETKEMACGSREQGLASSLWCRTPADSRSAVAETASSVPCGARNSKSTCQPFLFKHAHTRTCTLTQTHKPPNHQTNKQQNKHTTTDPGWCVDLGFRGAHLGVAAAGQLYRDEQLLAPTWCGTKEMMQPCPTHLHPISLVPRAAASSCVAPPSGPPSVRVTVCDSFGFGATTSWISGFDDAGATSWIKEIPPPPPPFWPPPCCPPPPPPPPSSSSMPPPPPPDAAAVAA